MDDHLLGSKTIGDECFLERAEATPLFAPLATRESTSYHSVLHLVQPLTLFIQSIRGDCLRLWQLPSCFEETRVNSSGVGSLSGVQFPNLTSEIACSASIVSGEAHERSCANRAQTPFKTGSADFVLILFGSLHKKVKMSDICDL